jgi:putative aminopeptidase FrvX
MNTAHTLLHDLDSLVRLPGIAGLEDAVSRWMYDQWMPLADAVQIDSLGNVIARFGTEHSSSITVLAHMDTVGMLVKQILDPETIGIVPVGGVNFKALPGTRLRVGEQNGVAEVRSQHQAKSSDGLATAEQIVIRVADTGTLHVTQPIHYTAEPYWVGDTLVSPHLDNRASCAVLMELGRWLAAQRLKETIYLVGTVQEETTCLGAQFALGTIRPRAALFVDGTVSYDTKESRSEGSVKLGSGPVLTAFLYTSGANGWHADPMLRDYLKQSATQAGVPYQEDAVHGLMSDAKAAIPLGIPSAVIGLPMRGKHSAAEMVHRHDLENTIALLQAALPALPQHQRG